MFDERAAAEEFARAIERVQRGIVNSIMALKARGLTTDEILLNLAATDMESYILNTLGLQTDIDNLMANYQTGILANMSQFGKITEAMLQSLVTIDKNALISYSGKTMANLIKQELTRHIIAGSSRADMLNALFSGQNKLLTKPQIKTLISTTFKTFSRSVTSLMSKTASKGQKYRYEGVVDGKTRPICLQMISSGDLTRDEVDSNFGGAFETGGGFNCRHKWNPVEAVAESNKSQASSFIKELQNEGKWKTPQTPKELYG